MPRVPALLTLAAVLAVGAGLAYASWQRADPKPMPPDSTAGPAPQSPSPAHDPATPPTDSIPVEELRAEPLPGDRIPAAQRTIGLPDGSRIAVLNGAYGAPDMLGAWPDDRPWSPIVRIETDGFGDQWYVHADESRSQTVVREVRRGGNPSFQPLTVVYTPDEGEVLLPDEAATGKE